MDQKSHGASAATKTQEQLATIRLVVPMKDGYVISAYEPSRFSNGDYDAQPNDTDKIVALAPGCWWIRDENALRDLGLTKQQLEQGQTFTVPTVDQFNNNT